VAEEVRLRAEDENSVWPYERDQGHRKERGVRICVVGAGAMGSAIGGLLSTTDARVVLLDNRKEHVAELNARGVIVDDGRSRRTIKVAATSDAASVGEVDLVVMMVKSYDTVNAMTQARSIVGRTTRVLTLQNGLGNEERLAEVVGAETVVGGVTHTGSVLSGSGEVHFGGAGKKTYIGELNRRNDATVDQIVRLFNAAGLETEATENILGAKWGKLLVNVAVSPLSAITRLTHGGMDQVLELKNCAYEAVEEAVRVAKASGVRLSMEDPQEVWRTATRGLSPEHKSSMLKDIERRVRTEIDVINGAVVRYGQRCGVPTPVNSTLVACIKGIEFGHRSGESDAKA
jgi:2-dehydropantoate 2-reductase